MPEMNLQMRQMWTLVKREFQEYRTIFLYMPIGFALLVVAAFAYAMYRVQADGLIFFAGQGMPVNPGDQVGEFAGSIFGQSLAFFAETPLPVRELTINSWLNSMTPGLFIAYWGSMFFYFILTVYQTRKDRSILFYNSMPVSDSQTILSKLIAGTLAVQLVYLVVMLMMQLMMLIVLSVAGLAAGLGSNIFAVFWQPAEPLINVLKVLMLVPLGILWTLPVYGALLLGSAWARTAPFAWVAALPVTVIAVEGIVYESTSTIAMLVRHSIPYWMYTPAGPDPRYLVTWTTAAMNREMLVSILIGTAFVWLAIRFNRSEDY